ncbi:MAG: L-seryl-tRNA(Sec) selenium transferase [Acidobacteria bacterium]|nr:L-seryl-tRNA(Sec) selenium transferase [Acidobacteriota bacterium]
MLRELPSIDELLRSATGVSLLPLAGPMYLTVLARGAVDEMRNQILAGDEDTADVLERCESRLAELWQRSQRDAVCRVINATGVIIHTNLGRAPYSDAAKRAISEVAAGYCTLEYDIKTGNRGRRGSYAEAMIAELTGAESALIVNNCAAAAFLVLSVFGKGGEVIVSRGELVEIGGDFRVPDVLEQSGAALCEVGTTNRTKIADYEKAIGENTRLILRVHPSNYRIVGFTAMPAVSELADLAHKNGIVLYDDIGSGALIDLSKYGLADEPVVADSIRDGADIVSFSGDKLLGGPQAGIIAGRSELIERIRKHPLYRALRVDKLAYAALEATLLSYRRGAAIEEIPVLTMLSATKDEVNAQTIRFAAALRSRVGESSTLNFEILDSRSAVGGGAAPLAMPETVVLAISDSRYSAAELGERLRNSTPAVIGRIEDDKVLLDLRTVGEADEELLNVLSRV